MDNTPKNRTFLAILAVVWTAVIIPLGIALVQIVVVLPKKGFPANLYDTILGWFFQPGPGLILTASVLGVLIFVSAASLRRQYSQGSNVLRKYLRSVVDDNQGLSPKGFAQQSQALISVNVPLDTIFIHLRAVPDRPVYDMPSEQQKLLEVLRQRTDLDPREQEMRLQDIRRVWHSQREYELGGRGQRPNSTIEEVLQQRTAMNPVAIILGAPGSGKSTTLRWVALQMAQARLLPWYRRWLNGLLHLLSTHSTWLHLPRSWGYHLPVGLAPEQIPILLRIRDYAPRLSTQQDYSFEQFFKDQLGNDLAEKLLAAMDKGRCLLLCDGLDEVASDSLRRRVADAIYTFIASHTSENASNAEHANRFIVTSRIVGYEAGAFSKYAHYTLLDLEDEQIKQFLMSWCPEVERHQMMFPQGMSPLTTQQEQQALTAGTAERERLLLALEKNPGIRRLALNPLMLTILALLQRSGKTLPQRRIDLYEVVTRTLLDNWNQESGRQILPSGEIQLAERLLSSLAYELHSSDPLITEREVKRITCQAMSDFYQRPASEHDAEQFIDLLRSSSGLFGESGQGLFGFMHRTFQEYYVALYLLDKQHYTTDTLKQFVADHYTIPIWHEPLLLTIAYKSGQRDRDEQQLASDLIELIADTQDSYDVVLHRSLLFAATCIVDCGPWSITPALQTRLVNALFDLYGDSFGAGRYTHLQEDIEEVMLLWLRGQPQESSQHATLPPLLQAWHTALCDPTNAVCQEGATHLLASLAPDLPSCPQLVLSILIPLLLKLACLDEDLPCPPEIRACLSRTTASPASLTVEEYAFIALRLLDADGPAGWLHQTWLTWHREQPELLERLTYHSLELDYLLTPAVFPAKYDNPNWEIQLKLVNEWKQRAQRHLHELQMQLLQASNAARYPHAYLYWKLLTGEGAAPGISWRETWDSLLREEMARGRSILSQRMVDTYQL